MWNDLRIRNHYMIGLWPYSVLNHLGYRWEICSTESTERSNLDLDYHRKTDGTSWLNRGCQKRSHNAWNSLGDQYKAFYIMIGLITLGIPEHCIVGYYYSLVHLLYLLSKDYIAALNCIKREKKRSGKADERRKQRWEKEAWVERRLVSHINITIKVHHL